MTDHCDCPRLPVPIGLNPQRPEKLCPMEVVRALCRTIVEYAANTDRSKDEDYTATLLTYLHATHELMKAVEIDQFAVKLEKAVEAALKEPNAPPPHVHNVVLAQLLKLGKAPDNRAGDPRQS